MYTSFTFVKHRDSLCPSPPDYQRYLRDTTRGPLPLKTTTKAESLANEEMLAKLQAQKANKSC